MITKTVEPIISPANEAIGIRSEYRIFGIRVYKKVYYTPLKYGVTSWELPYNF